MRRVQCQPAFVLHQRAYKNTSLLLEVFSRDHGRQGLVANGARKGRLAPLLQPFVPLQLSWLAGEDLGRLSGAEAVGVSTRLVGMAMICGFYLNELVYRLCHRHDPHPQIFAVYTESLQRLASAAPEPILRRFEWHLLNDLGYGPQLDYTADTDEAVVAEARYRYIPERGPVLLQRTGMDSDAVRISGRSLLALTRNELEDAEVLREVGQLMRACLRPLLGNRPLRSRELYVSMLKMRRQNDADQQS